MHECTSTLWTWAVALRVFLPKPAFTNLILSWTWSNKSASDRCVPRFTCVDLKCYNLSERTETKTWDTKLSLSRKLFLTATKQHRYRVKCLPYIFGRHNNTGVRWFLSWQDGAQHLKCLFQSSSAEPTSDRICWHSCQAQQGACIKLHKCTCWVDCTLSESQWRQRRCEPARASGVIQTFNFYLPLSPPAPNANNACFERFTQQNYINGLTRGVRHTSETRYRLSRGHIPIYYAPALSS